MAPPCSVFLELVSSSLQLVFTHCALGSRGSRATSPRHLPPKQERAGLCECFPTQTPTSLYLGTPGWGPSQAGLAQMPHCLPAPGGPFGHILYMGKLRLGQAGPPGHKVRKQWSWIESQCVHLTVRAPPITTVPTWAAAVPMQEAAWGQRETPDLLADLAHCPHHQPANVSVHRITTPWCNQPSSRTDEAGWCCCPIRRTVSPAKGTGRWR